MKLAHFIQVPVSRVKVERALNCPAADWQVTKFRQSCLICRCIRFANVHPRRYRHPRTYGNDTALYSAAFVGHNIPRAKAMGPTLVERRSAD
jgi:hypothetical protein